MRSRTGFAARWDRWLVREEKSIVLGRYWRPEPDIAIVRGPGIDIAGVTPRDDMAFLVEVAESTYPADRGAKWRRHAACGVRVYWIVNLNARVVEVYTNPSGRGATAAYRDTTLYGPDDQTPVLIEGREIGRVDVRDILP